MVKTKSFFWSKVVDIYRQVFLVFKRDPMVCFLFTFLIILDLIALTVLFLSHSAPFSNILRPIITYFTSPIYLHYPENFLLLPKLFHYAHFFINTFIGIVISGTVIKKIEYVLRENETVSVINAGGFVFKRYFGVLTAWLITFGLFSLIFKLISPAVTQNMWVYIASSYVVGALLQAFLVYLVPALLIEDRGMIKGLFKGFVFGAKNLLSTLLLICIPMLFVVLVSFLKALTPFYVEVFPEMTLVVLVFGIIVMAVVDLLVTSSATVLYLKVRNSK